MQRLLMMVTYVVLAGTWQVKEAWCVGGGGQTAASGTKAVNLGTGRRRHRWRNCTMKRVLLSLLLLCCSDLSLGQIQQQFESHMSSDGDHPDGRNWPFFGKFSFEQLPQGLDTAVVYCTLTVVREEAGPIGSWPIRVAYSSKAITLLSDSVFYWNGSHRNGDVFSVTLRFIPLTSGRSTVLLYLRPEGLNIDYAVFYLNGVSFEWCLDEDGRLTALGPSPNATQDCEPLPVTFYTRDHFIMQQTPSLSSWSLCDYEIDGSTSVRIGDTAVLSYHFKANRDLPEGYDLAYRGQSVQLLTGSAEIGKPYLKGDTFTVTVSFIPLKVRNNHSLLAEISDRTAAEDDVYGTQLIRCQFIFRDSGNLRYVSDEPWSVPRSVWPSNLPWADSEKDNSQLILDTRRK
ncbi:MAG: hypothetical protein AB1644_06425 [Candidatus Zixiibacteriota bacterium]